MAYLNLMHRAQGLIADQPESAAQIAAGRRVGSAKRSTPGAPKAGSRSRPTLLDLNAEPAVIDPGAAAPSAASAPGNRP